MLKILINMTHELGKNSKIIQKLYIIVCVDH